MVFNLSYGGQESVNYHCPEELCTIEYPTLDEAIRLSMDESTAEDCIVFYGRVDSRAAFKNLPIAKNQWRWLVMKAEHPITRQEFYFCDKTVPFGSSTSCRNYQITSEGIAHIYRYKTGGKLCQYLDYGLVMKALSRELCNQLIGQYIQLCQYIGMPVAHDKMIWATPIITFLGMLINSINRTIAIPLEKRNQALHEIDIILRKKKITVRQIQQIVGLLNFFCRAVFPGRAFTQRLYAKTRGLKQHHHVQVDSEMKADLEVWNTFITEEPLSIFRPFVDFSVEILAEDLDMASDASASGANAVGGYYKNHWFQGFWGTNPIDQFDTSIVFCELLGVVATALLYGVYFQNRRVRIKCDNQSIVSMVNRSSSKVKECMELIRILTAHSLKFNYKIFAKFVDTKNQTAKLTL